MATKLYTLVVNNKIPSSCISLDSKSDMVTISNALFFKGYTEHFKFSNNGLANILIGSKNFKGINYVDCIFPEFKIYSNKIDYPLEFENCDFEKFDFTNHAFKESVKFYSCSFLEKGSFIFDNTKFEKLADFFNSEFESSINFQKTDFHGNAVFSASKFHQNILFTYTTINGSLIFRDTDFKKGVDLSLAIINGKILPFALKIEDKDFEVVEQTKLTNIQYENLIQNEHKIPIRNKRETYRILKSSFLANNSNIDALTFESLEKKTYHIEMKIDGIKWFKSDMIIFKLNQISTNHKQSWWQGVAITGIFALFFYLLAVLPYQYWYICFSEECWAELWSSTLNHIIGIIFFLNPVHNPNEILSLLNLKANKLFWWYYAIDYLGRVFVGYGIYQTIQAFRKFK